MKKQKFENLTFKELKEKKKETRGIIIFFLVLVIICLILTVIFVKKVFIPSTAGLVAVLFPCAVIGNNLREINIEIKRRNIKQIKQGV